MTQLMNRRLEKQRNGKHFGRVHCIVSERWLQFPKRAEARLPVGDVMTVSVMTNNMDGEAHKLCDLILSRDELEQVLKLIGPPPEVV